MKWTVLKTESQISNKYSVKCSAFLAIRKMQIQSILRLHLISIRMATTKEAYNTKCEQECEERRILAHCWWECKLMQTLWKPAVMLLKIKARTIIWHRLTIPSHIQGTLKPITERSIPLQGCFHIHVYGWSNLTDKNMKSAYWLWVEK